MCATLPISHSQAYDYASTETAFVEAVGRPSIGGDALVCREFLTSNYHLFVKTDDPNCWRGAAIEGHPAVAFFQEPYQPPANVQEKE